MARKSNKKESGEKIGENKEEKESQDESKEAVNLTESQKNQAKYIFIIIAVLVGAIFITYWIVSESKKFDCVGTSWQKEMFGDIPIYTAIISGYGANGMPMNFKMVVRNNPKDLKVPIEGKIGYLKNSPVYFSINISSGINECAPAGGTIALVSFGQFMSGMGFNLITGVTTKNESELYKRPYITCEANPYGQDSGTTIILTPGSESKIIQEKSNPNCYTLYVKDCEMLEVMEKFEVTTLSEFTGREDC